MGYESSDDWECGAAAAVWAIVVGTTVAAFVGWLIARRMR